MSKLVRFVVGMAVVELLLAGLWHYLATLPNARPEAAETIGSVMGGAMGVTLAAGIALFAFNLVAARQRG